MPGLAFETKCASQGAFSRTTACSILTTAKTKVGAVGLDVSTFLEEVRDNHLLERADNAAIEFSHELYHDYFAATELETREQLKVGLGVEFALLHFSEAQWNDAYDCLLDSQVKVGLWSNVARRKILSSRGNYFGTKAMRIRNWWTICPTKHTCSCRQN